MLFNPNIMARLPIAELQRKAGGKFPAFQWRGSYSQFVAFQQECEADTGSDAGRDLKGYASDRFPDTWSGVTETKADFYATGGVFAQAQKSFTEHEAKLEADRFLPGSPLRTVFGPQWIVPETLAGIPQCGRLRQRIRLPPKNISLSVSVSCMVDWRDIARSVATIARASWDYLQAGGAVRVVVHYVYGFAKPCNGAHGVVFSVEIPLTNVASFASGVSAQQFRAMPIAIAQALSGQRNDGLPVIRLNMPDTIDVTGRLADDVKTREAFAIKT